MNEINENIFNEMQVLIVDDNKTTLHLFDCILKNIFKTLVLCENGDEALREFKLQSFDLIITDHMMPVMNGLEFIFLIREISKTIPIIFVSASESYEVYQKAINLNVTHSLDKPFSSKSLVAVLKNVIEPIFFHKSSIELRHDNLKDLQEQKKYDKHQQEEAFLKEHNAIRNDYYYSYYKHPSQEDLWYLDGSYRPHDILGGDTYSIRSLDKNRSFFFIIDAMGKGISASVTSILASSYINHLIDIHDGKMKFEVFLEDFSSFIIKSLLSEEVLAVVFAELDFSNHILRVSSYGMPPILLCDEEDKLIKIKTNNLPISRYNSTFNIQEHEVTNIKKMLFCSDGLVESSLPNGELYFSHLKQDFIRSKTRSSFMNKLYEKVPHPDDDITFLFFQKRTPEYNKMVKVTCETTLKDIEKKIIDFHSYLEENEVGPVFIAKLGMIFTEMIMNAYEHGNLEISNAHKKELILDGTFEDECKKRETLYAKRKIYMHYHIHPQGKGQCLKFDIQDEGNGFNTDIFKKLIFDTSSVNGRGFKIAKKMIDAIYYSQKGNHVILHKYIPNSTSNN